MIEDTTTRVDTRAGLADLAAFRRMYRGTAGLVRSALARLGVAEAARDDALQDVFVVAYRHRDEFDAGRPVEPWLMGIARRVAFRYRRSSARGQRKLAALQTAPAAAPVGDDAKLEAQRFLERFLAGLDHDRREVFVLGELYGLTGPEIAEQLKIPVDTAYTRLRAGRRRLELAVLADATTDPPARDATVRRGWLLLLPHLEPPAIRGGLLAATKLKLLGAAAVVGVVAAPVIVAPRPAPAPATAAAREAHATPARAATPATPATPVELAEPPPGSRFAQLLTPRAQPRARPPEDPLGANHLARAIEALAAGDAAEALALLDRHAREFPGSALAQARALARVRTLCALGRVAEARAAAATLRADGGLADEALARTCAAE